MESINKPQLEDDSTDSLPHLIEHRVPWLTLGLIGGVVGTLISSRFETLLSAHIELVYFIPVIVYMSDAVGTQTETIYIRNLAKKQGNFLTYLLKESLLGLALGALFGFLLGAVALIWFKSFDTALTVGLAMWITVAIAPIMAVVVPMFLQKERTDPALGAGPFTTVLQDLTSLLIYFFIASLILFR